MHRVVSSQLITPTDTIPYFHCYKQQHTKLPKGDTFYKLATLDSCGHNLPPPFAYP